MEFGIFAPMRAGIDVRRAVVATLQRWELTYSVEVARQYELDADRLPPVVSWATPQSFVDLPVHHAPLVSVSTPSLLEDPERMTSGRLDARFALGVVCVAAARSRDEAHDLADLYDLMCRMILVQHPDLGDTAEGLRWLDYRYDEVSGPEAASVKGATTSLFEVDFVNVGHGAPVGPTDPLSPEGDLAYVQPIPGASPGDPLRWPTIETPSIRVRKLVD